MLLDKKQMIDNTMHANEMLGLVTAAEAVEDFFRVINTAPLRHVEIGSNAPFWLKDLGFDEDRPFVVVSSGLYSGMGTSKNPPIWVYAIKANKELLTEAGVKFHYFSEGGGIGGHGVAIAVQTDKIDNRYNDIKNNSTI